MAWRPNPPPLDRHTPDAAAWLNHVAEVVFAEYSEWFTPDGCILATRIVVEVLKSLGVRRVDGASVCEMIANPLATAHLRQHRCEPRNPCPEMRALDGASIAGMG